MYSYLSPLLKKKPSHIFLHVDCNDSPNKTSSQILNELLNLKEHIETTLPTCKVFLSAPVMRLDESKAELTLKHLTCSMKALDNIILHENIDGSCLGRMGLHLNPRGSGRLAINFLSQMRLL